MRTSLWKRATTGVVSALLVSTAIVPTITATASAQQSAEEREREDRRRSRQTLGERTGRALGEALNLANEEPPQTQAALQVVNELLARNLPPYDRATALEIRGGLNASLENFDASIRDYEEILRLDVLPSDRTRQIRRNIAQLYFVGERFNEAISFMQRYIAEAGSEVEANDYFILAASYVQQNRYPPARSPAESALRLDQQAGERNKRFYDLLNLIYNELGLEAQRGRLLETMVEYFPGEESYWVQLASAYSAADRRADALAALEVAYKAGLLEGEDKIITLAQFYYDQNNPYRGGRLLEAEMAAGNVSRDLENLELLAQLWAAAREQEKAIAILTEAAPKRNDGSLYYQLGQSYLADEQYDLAIRNIRSAIRRGGLDDRDVGNGYVLIGTALFQQDSDTKESRQAARAEFVRAASYSTSRRTAEDWIEYIDTIEDTLIRQAQVEFSQAVERRNREIRRCGSIIDVIELGGRTEVPQERITECRALLARVDAGEEAEDMVMAELGVGRDGLPIEPETDETADGDTEADGE